LDGWYSALKQEVEEQLNGKMQIKAIVYDKTKSFLDQAGVRQFEAERQNIKMPSHSNPIFRQATTTVQNPTYNSPQFY
jgi:hypothetical protein